MWEGGKKMQELLNSYLGGILGDLILEEHKIKNKKIVRRWIKNLLQEGQIIEQKSEVYKLANI
jgi:hypothetical protein